MDTNTKLLEAKRRVDGMMGLPGVALRKGVARAGNPISGYTEYNYKLLRDEDRRWLYYCEWVDPDGEGYRVILPHEAVAGLLRAHDSIIAQARKERAQNAVRTRKRKAVEAAESILERES